MWTNCTMIKKIKETDWWEVSYLIIYAIIFSKEFLQTTMFPIPWPLGLGYVFALMSGGYVILKFLFHNTYTKKEMILAALVLIAFCVPAFTTDYTYLFWTGCLIVGAKDVDFNKILKVYLVLSITFMVMAFSASQYGLIEDLVYQATRDDYIVFRHSYGIIYPTDFAAHVFYIVVAMLCMIKEGTIWKVTPGLVVLGWFLVENCGARTSALCIFVLACEIILVRCFKNKLKTNIIYNVGNCVMVFLAILFLALTYSFDYSKSWMAKIDSLLSNRLINARNALNLFDYKLFGQHIGEIGLGMYSGEHPTYFFLDNSYIRIALMYGVVLLFVTLLIFVIMGRRAIINRELIVLEVIVVIAMHSFMEHHLLELAYNPILCLLFTKENWIKDKG